MPKKFPVTKRERDFWRDHNARLEAALVKAQEEKDNESPTPQAS